MDTGSVFASRETPGSRGAGARARVTAAALLLALQVATIAHARFVSTRYLAWAPYDRITEYSLHAIVDGRLLSPPEIHRRYGLAALGTNNRSEAHVMTIVRQYEETYGRDDDAHVFLEYRVNGGELRRWQWPPP